MAGTLVFASCGKSDDPGKKVNCNTWSTEYAAILLEVANAANAWSANQNAQTCSDIVDAYTDAINAMEEFLDEECIPEASIPGIEAAISGWNTAKNAIDCNSIGS